MITSPQCQCGCYQYTRGGTFLPGHDAKLVSWVTTLIALAWAEHVKRTANGVYNDEFWVELGKARVLIPITHSKLQDKVNTWLERHPAIIKHLDDRSN